jgi:D-beta-D-heptose 7-phosphate kinase/D-beta-D-heptose 1-phosphate adenosyltransferase
MRDVDGVVVFDEETPAALIEALKPDVLVKGGDYTADQVVGREIVEKAGGRVHIVPLVKGKSSSGLVARPLG